MTIATREVFAVSFLEGWCQSSSLHLDPPFPEQVRCPGRDPLFSVQPVFNRLLRREAPSFSGKFFGFPIGGLQKPFSFRYDRVRDPQEETRCSGLPLFSRIPLLSSPLLSKGMVPRAGPRMGS